MAKTYTYADVLNAIQKQVPRSTEDVNAATICNMAQNMIWNAYDWRESLAELPPFFLIPNVQDYYKPFYNLPDDFHGLRKAFLTRTVSVPPFRQELSVIKDLRITHARYVPHAIGYLPEFHGLRVFPRFPENSGATDWMIEGTYKKKPVKISASNLSNTLPFDDVYFQVWIEAAKWASFSLAGDPREDKQWQKMVIAIQGMAENEGLELGDPSLYPSEPFAVTGQGFFMPGRLGYGV